ncbi:conserved hypothetical protein [Ricinus communis]|uniref:Uncharacterized protein n=1 Tax=Ricinus communis TaxID=3988 RepID=B9RSH7_RICCO|nr:conserved hypothetical protein [Ricinus communis]
MNSIGTSISSFHSQSAITDIVVAVVVMQLPPPIDPDTIGAHEYQPILAKFI